MRGGVTRALTLGSCHLFLVLLFIGVVIFRMTQLILIVIVDFELLGGFGAFVDRAHRRLILTRMFIVSVIVVIFGATRRARGENQSLKLARGVLWSAKIQRWPLVGLGTAGMA